MFIKIRRSFKSKSWWNTNEGFLTGYELDVIREGDVGATADEDDVELTEFSDEIEEWVMKNLLKLVWIQQSILKQDVEDLVRRTDLEEETILDVMRILNNLIVSNKSSR
jgi:N utilization substance protein A